MPPAGESGPALSRTVLGLTWLVLFSLYFYSFDLPNNPQFTRPGLWLTLPFDLMDLVDPPHIPNELPWGLRFLGQRVPLLLAAGVLWGGAWALGRLILRGLRPAPLQRLETVFVAGGLGLSALALVILGLGLIGALTRLPLLVILAMAAGTEVLLTVRGTAPLSEPEPTTAGSNVLSQRTAMLLICVLAGGALLGAMSPQSDFDVLEYHLGGPKEWFLQGRIVRLPHNVYTSFPFLTEMLLLGGMVITGDWSWGALVGQAVIAGFAPLTAIGLWGFGRRVFGPGVGALSAVVWMSTPWVYRISIIAYAEGGLACYLFAAHALALRRIWIEPPSVTPDACGRDLRSSIVCGLLAGSAFSCKYTGLVSVVLPVGVLVVGARWWRERRWLTNEAAVWLAVYAAGCALAAGPWLIKNAIETGNPVYPLAWRVFGGIDRDEQMDAQWRNGHRRHYDSIQQQLLDVPVKIQDVIADNDWHSALMFGFAPVSLLAVWRRRVWGMWILIGWQFAAWFLLTHQIDRFYVPMFPLVALLAGCGGAWLLSAPGGHWALIPIAAGILFNVGVMSQQRIAGFNAGRLDLPSAMDVAVAPHIRWLNQQWSDGVLPPDSRVLCVGEAALFHARFPYLYNTVFDRSWFAMGLGEQTIDGWRPAPGPRARDFLKQHGITHVLMNWSEILRYREPGSYGYVDLAHPAMLQTLQRDGVLGAPLFLPDSVALQDAGNRVPQTRNWAPQLLIPRGEMTALKAIEIYPVLP